jgi:hypothetical protein
LLVEKQRVNKEKKRVKQHLKSLNFCTKVTELPLLWQQCFNVADILILIKVIYLENDISDPQLLFHKIISLSVLNYFEKFKKK